MYLCHGPFRWPWWCADAIQSASPDAAWPGLHQKPLNTTVGQLLAPYRPGGRQGIISTTIMQHVPTLLAVLMAIAMQRYYYTTCITRWRRFVAFIKATKWHHRARTRSNSIKGTRQSQLFWTFHREKELQLTCWPLITIGVWHIKLMRRTSIIW